MTRERRFLRDQRGQSTAMVVVMLWVLILFVALVANVGQAVNRRVALQVVADSGAYTGATKMSEGLNYMAHANGVIQDFWGMASWAWLANTLAIGGTCGAFDGINSAYNGLQMAMYIPMEAINISYGGLGSPFGIVRMEAERVSNYNARDLFPNEEIKYDEVSLDFNMPIPPSRDMGLEMWGIEDVPDGTDANTSYEPVPPLDLGGFRSNVIQGCWTTCGIFPCYIPQSWDFNAWKQRSGSDTRYFVWIARAPATRSLIFDSFFGPNAVPEMKAIGVARPVGGDIKEGHPKYRAEMVPVKRVLKTGFIIDPDSPWGSMRRVTH